MRFSSMALKTRGVEVLTHLRKPLVLIFKFLFEYPRKAVYNTMQEIAIHLS